MLAAACCGEGSFEVVLSIMRAPMPMNDLLLCFRDFGGEGALRMLIKYSVISLPFA